MCTSGSSFKTLKQLSRSGWTSPSVTLDGPWSNTKIARKLVWTRLQNRFGSTATVGVQQWILLARHRVVGSMQCQSTKAFMMRFLGSTSVRIMSWFVHTSCEFRISPIRWARNQNSKDRNSSAVEDHLEVYPSGESYGIESHLTSRNGVLILPHHQGGRGPKPPKPHLQLDTSVLESEYLHSKTKNSANRGHGLLPLVASEFWIRKFRNSPTLWADLRWGLWS